MDLRRIWTEEGLILSDQFDVYAYATFLAKVYHAGDAVYNAETAHLLDIGKLFRREWRTVPMKEFRQAMLRRIVSPNPLRVCCSCIAQPDISCERCATERNFRATTSVFSGKNPFFWL